MGVELVVQKVTQEGQLPGDKDLKCWAEAVLRKYSPGYQVIIRLVDEDEARQLNASYRDRDAATNVLSFRSALPEEIQSHLETETGNRQLGDLVICAPVVNREAREQDKPGRDHWAHLVIHGILHLLGHDHQRPEQAIAMEQLENEILASLGIPDPYVSR
jgi:probable rRNA maturation factor